MSEETLRRHLGDFERALEAAEVVRVQRFHAVVGLHTVFNELLCERVARRLHVSQRS